MIEKLRIKSSTVWIGSGAGVDVYRSIEDVPARLRAQLARNVESERAVTIFIADRRGREELVRVLAARPVSAAKPMPQGQSEDNAEDVARQQPFLARMEIGLFAIILLVALSIFFLSQG